MSTVEILILGLALSMDAFAVTISNTFAYRNLTRARKAWMPLAFGIFQGIMPLIGYLLGQLVSDVISQYAGILTFVILAGIGGKMIWDAFHEEEEEEGEESTLTLPVLLFQALATSIDALAIGVSFAALSVNVGFAVSLIAATTALTCTVALLIGKRFGNALGERATIVGGIVLLLIGIKSLIMQPRPPLPRGTPNPNPSPEKEIGPILARAHRGTQRLACGGAYACALFLTIYRIGA